MLLVNSDNNRCAHLRLFLCLKRFCLKNLQIYITPTTMDSKGIMLKTLGKIPCVYKVMRQHGNNAITTEKN